MKPSDIRRHHYTRPHLMKGHADIFDKLRMRGVLCAQRTGAGSRRDLRALACRAKWGDIISPRFRPFAEQVQKPTSGRRFHTQKFAFQPLDNTPSIGYRKQAARLSIGEWQQGHERARLMWVTLIVWSSFVPSCENRKTYHGTTVFVHNTHDHVLLYPVSCAVQT